MTFVAFFSDLASACAIVGCIWLLLLLLDAGGEHKAEAALEVLGLGALDELSDLDDEEDDEDEGFLVDEAGSGESLSSSMVMSPSLDVCSELSLSSFCFCLSRIFSIILEINK